jgi:hypothetical protein
MDLDIILHIFSHSDLDTKFSITFTSMRLFNATKQYVNRSPYAAILCMDYYSLVRLNNRAWTERIDIITVCEHRSVPLLRTYLKYNSRLVELDRTIYILLLRKNLLMAKTLAELYARDL